MKYKMETPIMRNEKVLILKRNNLIVHSQEKNIADIDIDDVVGSTKQIAESNIAMFIDEDGSTLILKNRYGKDGILTSKN